MAARSQEEDGPHLFVTPERAAIVRERLKEKLAQRQAAKADFVSACTRIASEPRSSFGEFARSFEDIVPDDLGRELSGVAIE